MENGPPEMKKRYSYRGMVHLPSLLQILSSSLGMVSPQSDGSPTSERAPSKFLSLVKLERIEENTEPSHREDGLTGFFSWFLGSLFHITIEDSIKRKRHFKGEEEINDSEIRGNKDLE